jgi:hypothetical protein
VVYAKWDTQEKRLPYLCQMGVGLPAMPALVQTFRMNRGMEPLRPFGRAIMAPPANTAELDDWHLQYGYLFEMGTLYTMIAGLLNILVMYDAFAGPVFMIPDSKRRQLAKQEAEKDKNSDEKGDSGGKQPSDNHDQSTVASKSR